MLSLSEHTDTGVTTLTARGEIDLTTAGQVAGRIGALTQIGANRLVVDLSGVTFLDSAGISVLLRGRRLADAHQVGYRITGAAGLVREVLDLTGVWTHLSGPADEQP